VVNAAAETSGSVGDVGSGGGSGESGREANDSNHGGDGSGSDAEGTNPIEISSPAPDGLDDGMTTHRTNQVCV